MRWISSTIFLTGMGNRPIVRPRRRPAPLNGVGAARAFAWASYEVHGQPAGRWTLQSSNTLGSCPENNGAAGAIGGTRWAELHTQAPMRLSFFVRQHERETMLSGDDCPVGFAVRGAFCLPHAFASCRPKGRCPVRLLLELSGGDVLDLQISSLVRRLGGSVTS